MIILLLCIYSRGRYEHQQKGKKRLFHLYTSIFECKNTLFTAYILLFMENFIVFYQFSKIFLQKVWWIKKNTLPLHPQLRNNALLQ